MPHDYDQRDQYDRVAALVPGGTRFYIRTWRDRARHDVTFEREIRNTGAYACYTIIGCLPTLAEDAIEPLADLIDEGL